MCSFRVCFWCLLDFVQKKRSLHQNKNDFEHIYCIIFGQIFAFNYCCYYCYGHTHTNDYEQKDSLFNCHLLHVFIPFLFWITFYIFILRSMWIAINQFNCGDFVRISCFYSVGVRNKRSHSQCAFFSASFNFVLSIFRLICIIFPISIVPISAVCARECVL